MRDPRIPPFERLFQSAKNMSGHRAHLVPKRRSPASLVEALAHAGPSIVDVPVDYGENARLTERLGQLVCPI